MSLQNLSKEILILGEIDDTTTQINDLELRIAQLEMGISELESQRLDNRYSLFLVRQNNFTNQPLIWCETRPTEKKKVFDAIENSLPLHDIGTKPVDGKTSESFFPMFYDGGAFIHDNWRFVNVKAGYNAKQLRYVPDSDLEFDEEADYVLVGERDPVYFDGDENSYTFGLGYSALGKESEVSTSAISYLVRTHCPDIPFYVVTKFGTHHYVNCRPNSRCRPHVDKIVEHLHKKTLSKKTLSKKTLF